MKHWIVAALALAGTVRSGASAQPSLVRVQESQDAVTDSEALTRRVEELLALGPDGALIALDSFAAGSLDQRRARSLVVRHGGDERAIDGALEALDDPDELVRRNLLVFVANPELPERERRSEALFERALLDVDGELRRMAIVGLASIGTEEAVGWLVRGVHELSGSDRSDAARALAGMPAARANVLELVRTSFVRGAEKLGVRLTDDVLATLLSAYGQRLAETPAGGAAPADRVPFVLGRSHPSPDVRAASDRALTSYIGRLLFLGRGERADAALAALIEEGLEPEDSWSRRAQLALDGVVDIELARRAADEIRRLADDPHEEGRLFWLWQAEVLAAATELCAGRPADAEQPLARARGVCEAMFGLGYEELPPNQELALERELLATRPEAHDRLALVEVLEIVRLCAAGREPGDRQVLEHARSAHVALLRGQLAARRTGIEVQGTWDGVLSDHRVSPLSLFGSGRALAGLSTESALGLAQATCRAIASVAGRELIGFEPIAGVAPSLADPLDDPERIGLLDEIQNVDLRAVDRRIVKIRREIQAAELAGRKAPDLEQLLNRLRALQRQLSQQRGSVKEGLPRMRPPSAAGLRLADLLRVDGRTSEALELARRLRVHYDRLEIYRSPNTLMMSSRIDQAIGAALTDLGRALEADQVMTGAVARLEELEAEMAARGFELSDIQSVRYDRMNVLVSLAVNANVKLGDTERALEYFERAYAIRQDDFMRILLGCYRARVGQEDEARAAIADVIPSPSTYYNLACTHALLGDIEIALDYLLREFTENHASASSLEHQQEWAREDPDLAPLRDDPRFELLLQRKFE